jgi:hypothetical protein
LRDYCVPLVFIVRPGQREIYPGLSERRTTECKYFIDTQHHVRREDEEKEEKKNPKHSVVVNVNVLHLRLPEENEEYH